MKISLKGFNEQVATFEAASGMEAEVPVKVSANGTVSKCSEGDIFCGYSLAVRGSTASVQLKGYFNVPFTGEAPALGYSAVSANATNGVKADINGIKVLVTDVDETNGRVGFII